jgi:hypothetical protein
MKLLFVSRLSAPLRRVQNREASLFAEVMARPSVHVPPTLMVADSAGCMPKASSRAMPANDFLHCRCRRRRT